MDEYQIICPFPRIQQPPQQQYGLCICVGSIMMFYYEVPPTDQLIFLYFGFKVCGVGWGRSSSTSTFKKRGEYKRLEYLCDKAVLFHTLSFHVHLL